METNNNKMMTITLENLTPSTLTIYKNGVLDQTIDTTTITTYDYTLTNGIYLFENNGKDIRFYLDDETKCKLYNTLCSGNAYYYYTALDLIQTCNDKYAEGVELYTELTKIIENDCDCVHQ